MSAAPAVALERASIEWSRVPLEERGERYVDLVSTCGRFRIERGYGAPSASGYHDGWALLVRGENGFRWREDARSLDAAKACAERIARRA